MHRSRALLFVFALLAVAALPAAAQNIPAGNDYWTTYGTGNTYVNLPAGELESLCGLPPTAGWNRTLRFRGVPVFADSDTIVRRLDNATFSTTTGNTATVRVQVTGLRFQGLTTYSTPCGPVTVQATLNGQQPITSMKITRTSATGGFFNSQLRVNAQLIFTHAGTTTELGRLFYNFDLPDPGNTVWSYGGIGGWRPAVNAANDCFATARAKIQTYPDPASHEYYISYYQSRGICPPPPQ